MNAESLHKLFDEVRRGKLSPDDAVARLRHLPFEDLGFAKVDHHRALRTGMPEVIFSERKTPAQVAGIFAKILDDRIESEGVQVGLPDGFLHQMWGLCNDARAQVTERVWLDMNSSDQPSSKARVRELTYRALLAVIETSG